MKLSVVNDDGIEISVNAKTIKIYSETSNLLKARLRIVAAEISNVERKIKELDRIVEDNQLSLVLSYNILQQFDEKNLYFRY